MHVMIHSPSPRKAARPRVWLALLFLTFLLVGTRNLASAQTRIEPLLSGQLSAPPEGDKSTLPFAYVQMNANSLPVYAQPSDAATGEPPEQLYGAGFVWMSLADPSPVYQEGHAWYKIRPDGYVPAEDVTVFQPSEYQGIALAQAREKPFGWIVFGARVSNTPGTAAIKTATFLPRYSLVTIYEERKVGDWTWYRIGENQWVEQRQVGIVKPSPRPEGVAPEDKWIEVNLYEQTLAAYEGDRMVYATLVSSGLPRWPTPTGLSRIWAKAASSKMSGRDGYPDYYFLQDVPWIMYFDGAVALHGAYWHDRFGAPHSHGCVNLSPKDALWLFNWTTPSPGPNNWTLPKPDDAGTWVWVHN